MRKIKETIMKYSTGFYVYNMELFKDSLAIALVVSCGSMKESVNQRGFSHIIEHMNLFFDRYSCDRKIKCLGYTDFFYTYYLFVTYGLNISECMERIKEIVTGKYISNGILKSIKMDVLEEYYRKDKESNKEYKCLFNGTEYSDHFAIGNIDVIKDCKYSDISKYYKEHYIPENTDIIIMGNKAVIENYISNDCIVRHARKVTLRPKYCIADLDWIKSGNSGQLRLYFYRHYVERDKTDLMYDSVFLSLLERAALNIYGKTDVGKIVFSSTEEFIYIEANNMLMKNISDVKSFLQEIVLMADIEFISEFIVKYKEEFYNQMKNGYGINLVEEMKQCISSLDIYGELIGCRELNDIMLQGLDRIDVMKISRMINALINYNESFFLYKIIEL